METNTVLAFGHPSVCNRRSRLFRAEWVPPSEVPQPPGPAELPDSQPETPAPGPGELPSGPAETPQSPPPEVPDDQ